MPMILTRTAAPAGHVDSCTACAAVGPVAVLTTERATVRTLRGARQQKLRAAYCAACEPPS